MSTDRSPSAMVYAVAWSPDRRHIASGGHDRMVHVWDATTGVTSFVYHGHTAGVTTIAWSPDGKRIASASKDNIVQVWNAEHPPAINVTRPQLQGNVQTFRAHTDSVHAVVWLPDGKHIASASGDRSVQVWQAG